MRALTGRNVDPGGGPAELSYERADAISKSPDIGMRLLALLASSGVPLNCSRWPCACSAPPRPPIDGYPCSRVFLL